MKNIILIMLVILTSNVYAQNGLRYLGSTKKYSMKQALEMELKKVEGLFIRIDSEKDLEYFNTNICKFKSLKDLDIFVKDIKFYNFPECMCNLKKLIFIDFNDKTMIKQEFPKSFLTIKSLRYMRLYGNFTRVPNEIENLKKLQELAILKSDSLVLPSELKKLKKLTFLELYNVGITDMPKGLNNLEVLLLQRNNLGQIPPVIFEYKQLLVLDIGFNKITEIPNNIQLLTNLKELCLNDNKIKSVNISLLLKLKNLQHLSLYHNKISKVNQEKVFINLPECGMRLDDFSRYN